jgi:hypothetical protein
MILDQSLISEIDPEVRPEVQDLTLAADGEERNAGLAMKQATHFALPMETTSHVPTEMKIVALLK